MAVPTVTALEPSSGPAGTLVIIDGTGFLEDTSAVVFGTYSCGTNYTVISDTSIACYAPVGSGSSLDVKVTTSGGTNSSSSVKWTYSSYPGGSNSAPTVTNLAPSTSAYADGVGGDTVTITGTGFTTAKTVQFQDSTSGQYTYASFTVTDSTHISCIAPAGTGTVDVYVENAYGWSSNTGADDFTYPVGSAPTITSLTPNSGSEGMRVVIAGTNFTNAVSVIFGTEYAVFAIDSSTQITATVPPGTYGTTVDVRVTNADDISPNTANDNFTYVSKTPTGLTGTPMIGAILYKWTPINISGMRYNVYIDTNATPTTLVATVKDSTYTHKMSVGAGAVYCGVKSVDLMGSESTMSNIVGPLQPLEDLVTEITDEAIQGSLLACDLRPPKLVESLPTLPDINYPEGSLVFLTTDKTLYRVVGGGPNSNSDTLTRATWHDLSGSGHDWTSFYNFGWTTDSGWAGSGSAGDPYCLSFSGDNDYIQRSGDSDFNDTSFTWEFWIKPNGFPASFANCLLFNETYTTRGYRIGLKSDGKVTIWCSQSGGTGDVGTVQSTEAMTAGNWYHVAVTYNGTQARVFLNGVGSTATSITMVAPSSDTLVMGTTAGSGYLDAYVATARFYTSVLSDAQISTQYAASVDSVNYQKTDLILDLNARQALRPGAGPHSNSDTDKATWYDLVGTNNGTLNGFTYDATSGWVGSGASGDIYSLQFEDVGAANDNYISLPSIQTATDKIFSLEAWVRPGTTVHSGGIIYLSEGTSTTFASLSTSSGDRPLFSLKTWQTSSGTITYCPGSGTYPIFDGLWHHIVGTCDGTYMRCYLDGVQVGTDTAFTAGTMGTADTCVIGRNSWGSAWYRGRMAAVRVYDHQLSQDDITANYKMGPTGLGYKTSGLAIDFNALSAVKSNKWVPAIDSSQMNGVISGNQILGNTITAGQISAGAIGATELAALSIFAKNVTIADYENLIQNANSETSTTGKDTSITSADIEFRGVVAASPYKGSNARRITGLGTGTVQEFALCAPIPCKQGDWFHLTAMIKCGVDEGSYGGRVRIYGMTAALADVDSEQSTYQGTTTYTERSVNYEVTSGRSTVVYVQPRLAAASVLNQWVNFDELLFRKKMGGSLIVDGAISGQTITGATIQTAEPTAKRVKISAGSTDRIDFYPWDGCADANRGFLLTGGTSTDAYLALQSPTVDGAYGVIWMSALDNGGAGNGYSSMEVDADQVIIGNGLPGDNPYTAQGCRTALSGAVTIGPSRKSGIYREHEFLLPAASYANSSQAAEWACLDVGGGYTRANTGTETHPGVLQLTSAASTGAGCKMRTANDVILLNTTTVSPYNYDYAEYTFRCPSVTNPRVRMGFMVGDKIWDSQAPDSGDYGAFININGSTLKGYVYIDGTDYPTGASDYTISANTWYTAKVTIEDGDTTTFKLYSDAGVELWSKSLAYAPTGQGLAHGFIFWTLGSSAQNLFDIDYMNFFLAPRAR